MSAVPGSLAANRPTFDRLCAVWPVANEAERIAGYRAFDRLTRLGRAEAIEGASAFRDRGAALSASGLSHGYDLARFTASPFLRLYGVTLARSA